jgi:hypothetical protein
MENVGQNENKRSIGHLINLLLEEPKIREKVFEGFAEQKRDHHNVLVIVDIAKIRFGKYGWSGLGGFWNNLIKCYEEISFIDFFIKVWDALVDMTAGTDSNQAVIEGLSRETLLRGIKNKEYDWICDRFFDVCRHLTKSGYWNPEGTKAKLNRNRNYNNPDEVEIEIDAPTKQPVINYRVVDSVGDTFEIVNVRWKGGRR